MSKEFGQYLRLWQATDQFINSPSEENAIIAQEIISEIADSPRESSDQERPLSANTIRTHLDGQDHQEATNINLDPTNLLGLFNDISSQRFGNLLRIYRKKYGMSMASLQSRIGLEVGAPIGPQTTLSRWENGKALPHHINLVRAICKILKLSFSEQKELTNAYLYDLLRKHL